MNGETVPFPSIPSLPGGRPRGRRISSQTVADYLEQLRQEELERRRAADVERVNREQQDELDRLQRELEDLRREATPDRPAETPTPATAKKTVGEVIGSIFGILTGGMPSPAGAATGGMIRTQAKRGSPMSILGNISSVVGVLGQLQQLRRPAATPAMTPFARTMAAASPMTALTALPSLRGQVASVLPGGGFTTGRGFGGGMLAGGYRTAGVIGRKRSRRQNPTNVHALRRALRRVEGFIKIEKRVDKILRRVAPKARQARKVGFVKSRRR